MWVTLSRQLGPLLPVNVVNGPLIRHTVTDTDTHSRVYTHILQWVFKCMLKSTPWLLVRNILCLKSFSICMLSYYMSLIYCIVCCIFLMVGYKHGKHSGYTPPSWQVASLLQTEVTGKPGVTLPAMALPQRQDRAGLRPQPGAGYPHSVWIGAGK